MVPATVPGVPAIFVIPATVPAISVIPAKAGIQSVDCNGNVRAGLKTGNHTVVPAKAVTRKIAASGKPALFCTRWIPAFAGMTGMVAEVAGVVGMTGVTGAVAGMTGMVAEVAGVTEVAEFVSRA